MNTESKINILRHFADTITKYEIIRDCIIQQSPVLSTLTQPANNDIIDISIRVPLAQGGTI